MKLLMIFLFSVVTPELSARETVREDRSIKLTQVDYRRRVGIRVNAGSVAKLRLRSYIEYRYKPKSQRQ